MRNFQDKRDRRKLLYSHVTILGLLIVIGFIANAVVGIYQKRRLTLMTKATSARELAFVQARKDSLESDVARLSSDRGAEAELRSKFQVAKPGEEVIVVIDEREKATTSEAALGRTNKGFWEFLKSWFSK